MRPIYFFAFAFLIAGMLFVAGCPQTQTSDLGGGIGGGSCIPGGDKCVGLCAGKTGIIKNACSGGGVRNCDCDHPWNQGETGLVGSFD
jgi:hypothetical protein